MLTGFNGEFSDMELGFTGYQSISFIVNDTTGNTILGGPDATLIILNKTMKFTSGGMDILSIDGDNNRVVIGEYGLSLLGPI